MGYEICAKCLAYDEESRRVYTLAKALEEQPMDEESVEVYRGYVSRWLELAREKAMHQLMDHQEAK